MQPWTNCLLALTLLTLPGCFGGGPEDAPDTAAVSGTVTLDGEPLPDASVTYFPVDPTTGTRMASGLTDSSGQYSLDLTASTSGIPPGEYKVNISTALPDEDEVYSPEKVPVTYNRDTTLTVTVPDGPYDFDLKSEGEIVQSTAEEAE